MIEIEQMIKKNRADCTGCYSCYNSCPTQAITMKEDREGFRYPHVDEKLCITCGACERSCPVLNHPDVESQAVPEAYAAINEDEEIRKNSSSGGVFHLLAQEVLRDGGIVFGAGFDGKWEVSHQSAESEIELEKLRVSKYLQSRAENVYSLVKAELNKGRKVLFTGTPCQCAALRVFLKKDYKNLLVVDFICHGVPSPAVWRKYLAWRTSGKEIQGISFRNKNLSWERFLLAIFYKNANKYLCDLHHDVYMQGFLQNLYLRPSCHECRFCRQNRPVDITIADYWGIKLDLPEAYDGRGTSLVVLHSQAGKKVFSRLQVRKWKADFVTAISHNPSMVKASKPSSRREKFFQEFSSGNRDIGLLLSKYTRLSMEKRIKKYVSSLKNKIKAVFSS